MTLLEDINNMITKANFFDLMIIGNTTSDFIAFLNLTILKLLDVQTRNVND